MNSPDLTIGQASTLLVYAAMAAYAVAFVAFAVDLSGRVRGEATTTRRSVGIAMSTTYLAAAFHVAAVVLRGVAAGRVPWANSYEFTLTFTAVATVTFLIACRARDLRFLGALVTGPVLLLLGLAVSVFYVAADGVQPALQSYWLAIHVALAAAAAGLFSVGCAASVLQIAQAERERRIDGAALAGSGSRPVLAAEAAGVDSARDGSALATAAPTPAPKERPWDRALSRLPDSVQLERIAFRLNAVGFVLWTFTIIAGAIWAQHAWNRFWGWDPKETFSLVAWLGYAVYLHARLTKGWQGTRAAVVSLVAYGLVLFNFLGVNFLFSGLHSYTGLP